jgi:hypothetical protein
MGNKLASPFPTYDSAIANLNQMEIAHLKKNFKILSRGSETINLQLFVQVGYFMDTASRNDQYVFLRDDYTQQSMSVLIMSLLPSRTVELKLTGHLS